MKDKTTLKELFYKTLYLLQKKRTIWNRVQLYLVKKKAAKIMKKYPSWIEFDKICDINEGDFARINWYNPLDIDN